MSNVIAIIWDFDKTLIDCYMQDPIFKKYNINADNFWKEVNSLPEKYKEEQNVKVNPETIYLNHFINYVKNGKMSGLNNNMLRSFGKKLKFYNGIPEIFVDTQNLVTKDSKYKEYGIRVEHYIVSTGMKEIIKGSIIDKYVEDIWGCEFIEGKDKDNNTIISEIGFTIDNTTKTRALFEINKGVNKNSSIEVNSKIQDEMRRVPFQNMIYIADGPSDVPAFSVVKKNNGSTFAIYPPGNMDALKQVNNLIKDGRIDMYAEADYSKGTTAYMWIMNRVKEIAEKIYLSERNKLKESISSAPKHLS